MAASCISFVLGVPLIFKRTLSHIKTGWANYSLGSHLFLWKGLIGSWPHPCAYLASLWLLCYSGRDQCFSRDLMATEPRLSQEKFADLWSESKTFELPCRILSCLTSDPLALGPPIQFCSWMCVETACYGGRGENSVVDGSGGKAALVREVWMLSLQIWSFFGD